MAKKSIFVMQDSNEAIQDVINSISKLSTFEVVGSSCDGEQGLSLVKKLLPDFLIMGIVLKNLDGVAVMEEIKKLNLKTKIVMEKKTYIKPEIEIEEMAIESPMLTGSLTFNEGEVDTEDLENGQLSNRYRRTKRGQWGDLWYTGE